MKSNRLKLNPSKSEFIWCATTHHLRLADMTPFHLDDGDVPPALSIRNLVTYFDAMMDMTTHIKQLVRASFCLSATASPCNKTIDTNIYNDMTL